MSHQIFFQYHANGGDQAVSTKEIIDCFRPWVKAIDPDYFVVEYDEINSTTIYLDTTSDTTQNFMVSGPCGDARLEDALLVVARLGHAVSFEPGIEQPMVFDSETVHHLPDDLRSMEPFKTISGIDEYRNRFD